MEKTLRGQEKDLRSEDGALGQYSIGFGVHCPQKHQNSNLEIRNSKWFDRLTILSEVEGQYQMTKIQRTKTVLRDIRFRECNLVCLFLTLEH
jgi:hypothetical protein